MGDPTTETEIALLQQGLRALTDKLAEVDRNCDARSGHTDAKLDDMLKWMLTTMGGLLVTLIVYVVTHL